MAHQTKEIKQNVNKLHLRIKCVSAKQMMLQLNKQRKDIESIFSQENFFLSSLNLVSKFYPGFHDWYYCSFATKRFSFL